MRWMHFCWLAVFFCCWVMGSEAQADTWRSAFYPENWTPDFRTSEGKFLHDFSYAGYQRGEKPLPQRAGDSIDVTQPPYSADPTGVKDSTVAIQSALDAAAKAGGGIVLLPAGIYRVAPPTPESMAALRVQGSNIVLRGAGVDKTFIFNDAVVMTNKRVIEIKTNKTPGPDWYGEDPKSSSLLAADILFPSLRVPVKDVAPFSVGDLVAVRMDVTQRFIDQLGMTGKWVPPTKPHWGLKGVLYCRRVVSIDTSRNELVLDVPTRLPLLMADNARVSKLSDHMLSEVGLEDFSIGMRQHSKAGWEAAIPRLCPVPEPDQKTSPTGGADWGEGSFATAGTPAQEVHQSYAIAFNGVENGWMRRVNTYAPEGNHPSVHLLSNGVLLERSRFVTVESCVWKFPQYQGGGGNGYLYVFHSQDCLLRDCVAEGGRHNYDFGMMYSTGNVLLNCTAKDGKLASDFHMFLSAANLFDGQICDGDFLEARYRPWGGSVPHGVTTTQSVFWNTKGLRYTQPRIGFDGKVSKRSPVIVVSHQWGEGYVIGTRGPASAVDSDDNVEGVGQGDSLQPQSLYVDQLARRLGKSAAGN